MGRNLKSRFDLLKPNLTMQVEQKQQQQKLNHDAHAVSQRFQEREEVYVQDFRPSHAWLPGNIVKCSGLVSFRVKIDNGQVVCRHQDHLRKQSTPTLIMTDDTSTDNPMIKTSAQQPQRNLVVVPIDIQNDMITAILCILTVSTQVIVIVCLHSCIYRRERCSIVTCIV